MEPPLRPPLELMDDAVAEILLRIPPDDSAHLFRSAAVCRPWRRILSDGAFRRRYRVLHRSPFLLGFLQNLCDDGSIPRFVFAAAAPRLPIPALRCRHGWALLRSLGPEGLIVWDPISGGHKEVAVPEYPYHWCNATVFCAATDGCNHRDCCGGPFTVVFVGTDNEQDVTWACTYLSETDAWSAPTILTEGSGCILEQRPSLLTADAIYFILDYSKRILQYDMTGQLTLSVIYAPDFYQRPEGIAIAADDGGLGFAGVKDGILSLWCWYAGPDSIAGWVQRSIQSFAEGTDTTVMSTNVGVFAIKLKSGHVRKLGVTGSYYSIVPYVSFCIPVIQVKLVALRNTDVSG
ncbi:hypothetical protein EJB05_14369, partial [Eragrostis curvula]